MKHKFTGEMCVYCGRAEGTTKDHVVGRGFFLVEDRGNLPQAPACKRCNGEKAALECYLMNVLPFGAKHADAGTILKTLVAHRLNDPSNAKIRKQLEREARRSGFESVPIDSSRLEKLFAMIARGLAWHHYKVQLGDGFSAKGAVFNDAARATLIGMLSSARNRVVGDLGGGTFTYEGVQGDYPEHTLWRFTMYGGIEFGGDPNTPGPSSLAVAFTARREAVQNITYRDFQRDAKAPKVGRNDPCPCGSGKKHKTCHGSGVPGDFAQARLWGARMPAFCSPLVGVLAFPHLPEPGRAIRLRSGQVWGTRLASVNGARARA